VRLWAKFFSPVSNSDRIEVPLGWENFFIASLFNPSSFDWAKNFLISEAWDVILSDSRGDASISFSIPNKCSTKMKLECTISEIDEDGVDVSSEESASDISSDMQGQVVPPSLCAIKGSESFNDHDSLVTPDSKIAAEKKNASTSALLAKGWYPKFLWLCLK
jgi:hypothetical protein